MEFLKNTVRRYTEIVDNDNRAVHIGCYTVALVGLGIAIRRVRPFSKFKRPSDIPSHFIQERRELSGVVERIDPNGALLMINHKPLIPIPGIREGQLPVKVSGVRVSGLGINWLQVIVAGNPVKFVPVSKSDDYVQCEVLLPQTILDKKGKEKHNLVNVGESLVRIGFGEVTDIETINKEYALYAKHLRSAENYALRRKLGYKYYLNSLKESGQKIGKTFATLGRQLSIAQKVGAS